MFKDHLEHSVYNELHVSMSVKVLQADGMDIYTLNERVVFLQDCWSLIT